MEVNPGILKSLDQTSHRGQSNIVRGYAESTVYNAAKAVYARKFCVQPNTDWLNQTALNSIAIMAQFMHKNLNRHVPEILIENVFKTQRSDTG